MNNYMEQFFDLSFSRQPDGNIRLIQSGYGEEYIIEVHPAQLLFIARQMCGMKPETADKVEELERRIAVLTDKLQNIVCNKAFRSDLVEGIGEGFEYLAKLDGLLDLALEFDGGRLHPEYKEELDDGDKPITCATFAKHQKTQSDATAEGGEQLGLDV